MSHKNASKLLLLLTSSLVCLGCDDEPKIPTGQAPATQAPVSQALVTQAPATQAPVSQALVTQAPVTQAPVVQGSSAKDTSPGQVSPAAEPRTALGAATEVKPMAEAESARGAPTRSAPRSANSPSAAPEAKLETRGPATGINQALRGDEVQSPLLIDSSLEAAQGQWIARWTIRNEGQEPLYLVTQLPVLKSGKVQPNQHRIYVRPQGETLHVTKRMWRIPRGVSPLRPELPFLIRLEPGQVHQGAIRLPASIAASYPYRTSPSGARGLVNQVVISFGYFGQDAAPQPSAEAPGLFTLPYSALSKQAFVSSAPHPARLAVR